MSTEKPNYPPIRRVVTGHDQANVAKVLTDGPALNAKYPQPGTVSTMIWCTDGSPASMPVGETPEDMGAPHMHRTETIDYVIVLEGEIEMDMDQSSVKLKAGDVMVQRGTNHAWANRSNKRARVAFVLLDAEPLGIGKPVLGTASAR
jgi:mannose-6-phosphate isomerase-like protein (cupin superfamily)